MIKLIILGLHISWFYRARSLKRIYIRRRKMFRFNVRFHWFTKSVLSTFPMVYFVYKSLRILCFHRAVKSDNQSINCKQANLSPWPDSTTTGLSPTIRAETLHRETSNCCYSIWSPLNKGRGVGNSLRFVAWYLMRHTIPKNCSKEVFQMSNEDLFATAQTCHGRAN